MINDFNNGTVGWTDWNILLDENGGPNHVKNFCFAPIHADLKTNQIIYTPSYYYIGHFSKFIKPNAKRIANSSSRTTLETTAFKNPDGKIVTIVMNKTNEEVMYKLINKSQQIKLTIPAKAIQSILIN
jgi:glucosylceramidase